jgi:hypothetical protein
MDLCRWHIHGASVTAQTGNTGYAVQLGTNLRDRWPSDTLTVSAFGASHFDSAGYHFIGDVIRNAPHFCLMEWTTTSAKSLSRLKLDSVVRHLLLSEILPVWLTLPRADDLSANRRSLSDVRLVARRFECPLIDVAEVLKEYINPEILMRDVVHTTSEGATIYADRIFAGLVGIRGMTAQGSREGLPDIFGAKEFLPIPIIHLTADETGIPSEVHGTLKFTFFANSGLSEMTIEGLIGPYSPIAQVRIYSKAGIEFKNSKIIIFDPWCYYERSMVITLFSCELQAGEYVCEVELSNQDPQSIINLRQPLRDGVRGLVRRINVGRYSCVNVEIIK